MGRTFTSRQILNAKRKAMPAPLGDLHFHLTNELRLLHLKWKDFCALYATGKDTIEILNGAAPTFFFNLQRVLWEDVLLHICRLTDAPQSCGHDNLSVTRLGPAISDPKLRQRVERMVTRAISKSRFARDPRNRRLAHRELPVAKPRRLKRVGFRQVESALAILRDILNCIEKRFQNSTAPYEHTIEALGGVAALLYYLEEGLKAAGRDAREKLGL